MDLIGSSIGLVDHAYYLTRLSRNRPLFFKHGWGDVDCVTQEYQQLLDRCAAGKRPVVQSDLGSSQYPIDWQSARTEPAPKSKSAMQSAVSSITSVCCSSKRRQAKSNTASPQSREGVFLSPYAHLVPDECKNARFLCALPATARAPWDTQSSSSNVTESAVQSIVVLMTSTGEQGYGPRLELARVLTEKHGCMCILPMAPFYASRKPVGQRKHYINDVAGMSSQTLVTCSEVVLLCEWAHKHFPAAPICLSGFSWGGAMCSVSAMMLSMTITATQLASASSKSARGDKSTGWRVGVAPYAGSATPAPLVDGILAGDMDWQSLSTSVEKLPKCLSQQAGKPVKTVLFEYLRTLHLSRFALADLTPTVQLPRAGAHLNAFVCTSMSHDKFVSTAWSQDLFDILKQSVPPQTYSHLHWFGGGHVNAFLKRKQLQIGAIVEVLSELHSL